MVTTVSRIRRYILSVLCVVLGGSAIARAQTVVEDFDPGANSAVAAIAVQPDGKILVGGFFTKLGGGGTGTTTRNYIGRLNADGSLDSSFDPGANGFVLALAVQTDGKILVGGTFTALGGGTGTTPRNFIGRLNVDGTVDTSFNPGANNFVHSLVEQPDGKILVAGMFSGVGGGTGTTPRSRIGRLHGDGSVDPTFDPGAGGGPTDAGYVSTMAMQADGKIVVAGSFTTLGGGGTGTSPRRYIGRLNADGSVDSAFNQNGDVFSGDSTVRTVVIQPDGRILVGTDRPGDWTCRTLLRVDTNGSLDTGFNTPCIVGWVDALAMQTDGKILAVGALYPVGKIARFKADGSFDTTFNAKMIDGFVVRALAVRADGNILIGGQFMTLSGSGGTARDRRIGLLTNTDAASERLSVTGGGSVVTWARGGGAPELSNATFEVSRDGSSYTPLATATPVAGGWQATGQSLPINEQLFIKTRGYYTTGYGNGSGSVVESIHSVRLVPPTISRLPNLRTRRDTPITIPFTVGSAGNGAAAVAVFASSSNPAPVPNANLMLGGAGANRTLTIFPALHQIGATTITLMASDDGLTAVTSFVLVVYASVLGDFNGHGRADLTVFRPSTGTWYSLSTGSGAITGLQWGNGFDVPVPGDYDGDGPTDIAVFRPSNGTWYIVSSSTGAFSGVPWGNGYDRPVPGDYDGDGRTDVAVFRPSNGTWYILFSSTGAIGGVAWGNGFDRPVPGDYDGDGRTDVAVFRPSNGIWYVVLSSTGDATSLPWGNGNDLTVPGDYDGDGRTDFAVFRPSNGVWYVVLSSTGGVTGVQWGNGFDVPVPGDYDGDGRTDVAVFRPSNGTWYIIFSTTGTVGGFQWGNGNDVPIMKHP